MRERGQGEVRAFVANTNSVVVLLYAAAAAPHALTEAVL